MTDKPLKLIQRKHSKLVVEKIIEAHHAVEQFSPEQLAVAKSRFLKKKDSESALPHHIKQIRKYGLRWDLPADEDVQLQIDAETLVRQEEKQPGDFVSKRSDSAARSDTRTHQVGKRGPIFDPERIKDLLRRYMKERNFVEIPRDMTVNACAFVTKEWGHSPPGDSTLLAQISDLKKSSKLAAKLRHE